MVLKTFNIDKKIYTEYSTFCREHGISMSKQIELFMQTMLEEDLDKHKEHMEKLDRMKKGQFKAMYYTV
ncbi:hypothetical protein DRJ22_01055 [Candidatus Woesearchaeota archaeon]|nr:MAG: hypothetical protein DRJ22_01055 [Candidatus Woesearchaeota archaeon]